MFTYEINVGTITYAMKAVDLLRLSQFPASYHRNANAGADKGCGYMVTVSTNNIEAVKTILLSQNIPIKSIVKRGVAM